MGRIQDGDHAEHQQALLSRQVGERTFRLPQAGRDADLCGLRLLSATAKPGFFPASNPAVGSSSEASL